MNLKGVISEFVMGSIYYESILFIADTVATKRYEEMAFWEFTVFICRITFEYYENKSDGVYSKEPMYLKLDHMLPVWLAPIFATADFSYGEEFKYDEKQRKKREKAARKAAGLESDDDDDYDSEDETTEEE